MKTSPISPISIVTYDELVEGDGITSIAGVKNRRALVFEKIVVVGEHSVRMIARRPDGISIEVSVHPIWKMEVYR